MRNSSPDNSIIPKISHEDITKTITKFPVLGTLAGFSKRLTDNLRRQYWHFISQVPITLLSLSGISTELIS